MKSTGRINVLYSTTDIEIVRCETLEKLKQMAKDHHLQRARLCMHRDLAELTHEMIIVAHKSTYIRPHRHPRNKSESYHIIEGEMDVNVFSSDGRLHRVIRLALNGGDAFMYRISNGWWHQPVPRTEWVVYHETYSGPFEKSIDVEYADWAQAEQRKSGLSQS